MVIDCPHCGIKCDFFLVAVHLQPPTVSETITYGYCPNCDEIVVYLAKKGPFFGCVGANIEDVAIDFRLLYPRNSSRPPLPPEVPDEFAADYNEACLVLADSPKASAALARRCLQRILREKEGIAKEILGQQIEDLLATGTLPSYISEDLDAVRHFGNFAAHPIESKSTGEIVDVEPSEAEWTLNILEGLFDFYFVQEAKAQARRDALNAKLTDVGKHPMKTP